MYSNSLVGSDGIWSPDRMFLQTSGAFQSEKGELCFVRGVFSGKPDSCGKGGETENVLHSGKPA